MSIVSRYLSKRFLVRFVTVLGGLTLFVLMLEAVIFGAEIIASHQGENWVLLRYLTLRTPSVLATYNALAALVAALLMFVELSRHRELVAIWNVGQSPLQILLKFWPVLLIMGGLNFANDNILVPHTAKQLTDWGGGIFDLLALKKSEGKSKTHWFVVEDKVLSVKFISPDFQTMNDVIMFERSDDGGLINVVVSAKVTRKSNQWTFHQAKVFQKNSANAKMFKQKVFRIDFDPSILPLTPLPPSELSLSRLYQLKTTKGFGLAPKYLIETWIHKRLTSLVTGLISIFLAIAIAHGFAKARGAGQMFFAGISFGFVYFVFDAIAISTGETGLVDPILAGWFAPVFLIAVATWILLRFEVQRREH